MIDTIDTGGTRTWYGPVTGIVLAGIVSALLSAIFRVSDRSPPPRTSLDETFRPASPPYHPSGELGKLAGTLELVREKLDKIEEKGQIIDGQVN